MQITSTHFDNLDPIPRQFTQHGDNTNPSLTFSEIPEGTESLALIVEDPDAPHGTYTHWILYNMSPGTLQIVESELPVSGAQGLNDSGSATYAGPKPPSGTHRYIFKLFALDTTLKPSGRVTSKTFYELIDDHILEEAEIIGTYSAE